MSRQGRLGVTYNTLVAEQLADTIGVGVCLQEEQVCAVH